jgi:hypothetical protein
MFRTESRAGESWLGAFARFGELDGENSIAASPVRFSVAANGCGKI